MSKASYGIVALLIVLLTIIIVIATTNNKQSTTVTAPVAESSKYDELLDKYNELNASYTELQGNYAELENLLSDYTSDITLNYDMTLSNTEKSFTSYNGNAIVIQIPEAMYYALTDGTYDIAVNITLESANTTQVERQTFTVNSLVTGGRGDGYVSAEVMLPSDFEYPVVLSSDGQYDLYDTYYYSVSITIRNNNTNSTVVVVCPDNIECIYNIYDGYLFEVLSLAIEAR